MKAYAITLKDVSVSETATRQLIRSSKHVKNDFVVEKFFATTAEFANVTLAGEGLKWNYPWQGEVTDFASGLTKRAYQTAVKERRIACFMSHWRLWHQCIKNDEAILVLEHDALFTQKLDPEYILESNFDIVGINNPLMATRKARDYHTLIQNQTSEICNIPTIDSVTVPQGLAGNSAYIIKPAGAKNVIEAAREYGAWPNDALMCKQLIPRMGVTREYYTKVQGTASTTTG